MKDLIERLEKATGSDYGLSQDIGRALAMPQRYEHPGSENESWPNYTGSLDAALKLVPKESAIGLVAFSLEDNPDNKAGRYRATVMPPLAMSRLSDQTAYAKSLPLALCIAALRAREASGGQANV